MPFDSSWRHFDRAKSHRESAGREWNEWIKNDPYEVHLHVDETGDGELWFERVGELPTILPILFGEYLYNLRAALDNCVYDVAIHDAKSDPPPSDRELQFPICATESAWRTTQNQITGLSSKHRTWIKSVQPFLSDHPKSTILYVLNDLARRDRHRTLNVVGSFLVEARPIVSVPKGHSVVFDDVDPRRFVRESAVVTRFKVIPYVAGMHVEANPQAAIDIEIAEFVEFRIPEMPWLSVPLPQRLRGVELFIEGIIGRFERDCTGYTRVKALKDEGQIERMAAT